MSRQDHIGEGDRRDVTVHVPTAQVGQHHELGIAEEVETAGSIEARMYRGVNANRLTLLGIVASIALTIAFGIEGVGWLGRTAIGIGTFFGVGLLCRLVFSRWRARHVVMGFAYWMLHEEPIEDKPKKRA